MKGVIHCVLAALTGAISSIALADTAVGVDWSGFNAGGVVGVTESRSDASMLVGTQKYLDANDARQIARSEPNKLSPLGGSAGLFVGYGKQFGNVLVGVEASANSLSLKKTHVTKETIETVPTAQWTRTKTVSADWMTGVRLKLGWAESNWLAYLTGGVAATRLKLEASYEDNAFSGYSRGTTSATKIGWSMGFGGEYALSQHWSLRGEYLYSRFGNVNMETVTTSTNNSGGTLVHKANLEEHGLFVGVSYLFK